MRESGRIGQDKNGKSGKIYGEKTGTKHTKISLISGYAKLPDQQKYLYISPWICNCNCDTDVFNTWLEKVFILEAKLLQITYPNNPITLIMDNVPYHKSQKTREILEQNNINLKFQPAYSPDLNPIEPSWDTTKNDVRNYSSKSLSFYDKLCTSLNLRSWYSI